MYAQCLLTLEENPLNGLCSPPLMGSHGVVPLTVISVIPDIIQVNHSYLLEVKALLTGTSIWRTSSSGRRKKSSLPRVRPVPAI